MRRHSEDWGLGTPSDVLSWEHSVPATSEFRLPFPQLSLAAHRGHRTRQDDRGTPVGVQCPQYHCVPNVTVPIVPLPAGLRFRVGTGTC